MKEIYFAIRDDASPGSGTITDPYNGNTPSQLDSVLSDPAKAGTDTSIRFGPGLFRTNGRGGSVNTWFPRSGQRLIGAGMHQTILQLVEAAPAIAGTKDSISAISNDGGPAIDGLEISDLTIDVNLDRQPKPGGKPAPIECGAIRLSLAKNVLVRRVRVINWGTYTAAIENFPIFIESPQSSASGTNVVEDCIIEQPSLSNAREVTMLNNHAHWLSPEVMTTVRNNYLNGDFTTGAPPPPIEVTAIAYAGSTITVTTRWPHALQAGDSVWISGASVSAYNDRFPVSAVTNEFVFTIAQAGMPSPPGSIAGVLAQRHVPEAMVVASLAWNGTNIVTVTTPKAHKRKAGDWVRVSGVKLGSDLDLRYYNGTFQVLASPAPTATTFAVQLYENAPAAPAGGTIWLDRWPSQMVVIPPNDNGVWGLRGIGIGLALVQTRAPHFKAFGDHILIKGVGGANAAVWNGFWRVTAVLSTRELECVISTTNPPAAETDGNAYQTAAIVHEFQGITVITSHGARAYGNRLAGLLNAGPYHDMGPDPDEPTKDLTTFYNYYFFCYVGQFSNIANESTQNDREGWNVTRDNVIDLQPHPPGAWNHGPPGGILFWGPYPPTFPGPLHAMEVAVTRDNVIRFTGGVAGPGSNAGYNQYGIDVRSLRHWVVEDNLVLYPSFNSNPSILLLSYRNLESLSERTNLRIAMALLPTGQRF